MLVRVIASLAEVVRHEAFTQTQQATASLQISLEVGVLPSNNLETGL